MRICTLARHPNVNSTCMHRSMPAAGTHDYALKQGKQLHSLDAKDAGGGAGAGCTVGTCDPSMPHSWHRSHSSLNLANAAWQYSAAAATVIPSTSLSFS
uniref:Uncharacterized protein n=1 Tax=Arundo donax TaxID=35708 RepID=A0A0A9AEH6_ARUDO